MEEDNLEDEFDISEKRKVEDLSSDYKIETRRTLIERISTYSNNLISEKILYTASPLIVSCLVMESAIASGEIKEYKLALAKGVLSIASALTAGIFFERHRK